MDNLILRFLNYSVNFKWMVAALFGIMLGISLDLWLPKQAIGQYIVAGIGFIVIVLVGAIFSVKAVQYLQPRLHGYGRVFSVIGIVGYLLMGFWLSYNIPIPYPSHDFNSFLPLLVVKIIARLSNGMVIGGLLLFCSVWAAEKLTLSSKASNLTSFPTSFMFALPMALIWGVYLLAFYPGMMSADSMDQWGQMLTGVYNDHHPAFHTFLIWLVTRISLTPVSVAIAQIVALALVTGSWLAFLAQIRLPLWLIWLTAGVFAISPVNGTMVNTLWKDIPYSTAVLGLTLILAKIVYSKGRWMDSLNARVILGVTLALVLLLRHDGAPVAVGTIVILLALYPSRWHKWLVVTFVCVLLYFGVRGPIYQWVGVQRSTSLAEYSLSLWSMAAYARPGSTTDEVITSLSPFSPIWGCDIWKSINPTWRQTDLDLSLSSTQLITNLIERGPRILLYYFRCNRSMEWIVWDPYGEIRNASHVEVLVDPNPFGIRHDSKIPFLRNWIASWVIKTAHDPNLNWFIWRPAFFLYLHLLIIGVLILRNRDFRFLAVSAPILIQSITFSLTFAAPNFRYHYAVYLVSLICLPLLFSSALSESRANLNKSIGVYDNVSEC